MNSFNPGPEHALELRTALGKFATGVTVVTTGTEAGPIGMTANSFTSVSLNPPLVLWCPAVVSERHDAFVQASHFAIHILTAEQRPLSDAFAREAQPFHLCDWVEGPHGMPLIQGTAARLECVTENVTLAGDHSIVLGRVTRVTTEEAVPLAFLGGTYGTVR